MDADKIMIPLRPERALLPVRGIKAPIVFMSFLTSLSGYLAYPGAACAPSLAAPAFTALVTAGALLLNNIQDRDLDGLMYRTMGRPLATGELGIPAAALLAGIFTAAGSLGLLASTGSPGASILALAALGLYNLAYTPLKRRTTFAVIPGIVSGSMPLYIGWISGGGPFLSPQIGALMTVMSVWQVPHTWITGLMNLSDYRAAQVPVMASLVDPSALRRLVFLWTFTFAASTLWIPLMGITMSPVSALLIALNAIALVMVFLFLEVLRKTGADYRFLFRYLNISAAALFIIIIADVAG